MAYTTATDVLRLSGITTNEVSEANIKEFIKDAEIEVDKYTYTTYWSVEDSGTATAGANSALTDSGKSWTVNDYDDGQYFIWIYGGTGINQVEKIESNTATILTIDTTWTTNPDNTSTYRIIRCGHDPRITESRRGNNADILFVKKYPIRRLNSATIDDTSITTTNITQTNGGGLILSEDAERSHWLYDRDPKCDLDYHYGVYPVPREVKLLTGVIAAMLCLGAQAGGTHSRVTNYVLPSGVQVQTGEPSANIRATYYILQKRYTELLQLVRKYPTAIV